MKLKNPKISCENQPKWYKQLLKMDEETRKRAVEFTLSKIKEAKPDAYKFIEQFNLELVGFMPNLSYTMPDDGEGNLAVTFVHDYSQYTLLFWCKQGGFGMFINPSLNYNANGLMGFIY
jgi:hypothetical protein